MADLNEEEFVTKIKKLEKEIKKLEKEINSADRLEEGSKNRIGILKGDVHRLNEEATVAKVEFTELKEEIDTLNTGITRYST